MVERIILLGDSYTFGHGCSDRIHYYDFNKKEFVGTMKPEFEKIPSEHCWGSLLQKQFSNIEVINIASPGNSYVGMFRNLVNAQDKFKLNSNDLIMMNGTFPDRIEIDACHQPGTPVSWSISMADFTVGAPSSDRYSQAKRDYVKYLYNDAIGTNQAMASFMGIYGISRLYDTQFLWSRPPPIREAYDLKLENMLTSMVDKFYPHMYKYDFSGFNSINFNEQNCYQPDQHCNDLGHEIYYTKVILPLITKLLGSE
jgi:hypothetical protein